MFEWFRKGKPLTEYEMAKRKIYSRMAKEYTEARDRILLEEGERDDPRNKT